MGEYLYHRLHQYITLKEQQENQIRTRNRNYIKQLVEQEQNEQIEEEYLEDDVYQKKLITREFLQRTFTFYGGNPFQVQINQQAIRNLEILLVCTTQKVLLLAQEVDGLLLQLLQNNTPEQLLEITGQPQPQKRQALETLVEDEESEENNASVEEFDMLQGMNIQKELQKWKGKAKAKLEKQHTRPDSQKCVKRSNTQKTLPSREKSQPSNQIVEHRSAEPNKLVTFELQELIDNEMERIQQEFGQSIQGNAKSGQDSSPSYHSQMISPQDFDDSLQDQPQEEYSVTMFQPDICDSVEVAEKLNSRFAEMKIQIETNKLNKKSLSSQREGKDIKDIRMGHPIIEEQNEEDLSIKYTEIPVIKESKPRDSKVSLVASLFTSNILKEIQQLNQIDIGEPEPQTLTQNVKQSTAPQQGTQQQNQSVNRGRSTSPKPIQHSQYKISLLCEIRNSLEIDSIEEQKSEIIPNTNAQLIAKGPQMLDFLAQLVKEYQSKHFLSRGMREKVNQQYRDIVHLTRKQPEAINTKLKEIPQLEEGSLKAWRGVQNSMNFFSAGFISSIFNEQNLGSIETRIYSLIVVVYAMLDSKFPLLNNKMPKIDTKLLKCVFQNPAKLSMTFRNLHNIFLKQEIQQNVLMEFEKQFTELDQVVESSNESCLRRPEISHLIKMIYYIKYYIDCLKDSNNLNLSKDTVPQLNSEMNALYEQHIWKNQGSRYQSAKQTDMLQQQHSEQTYEKYGIDFRSWEINLQIQEEEIKRIAKVEKELEWKERRLTKQLKVIEQQKENAEEIETNQEKLAKNQLKKDEDLKQRKQEKQEQLRQKSELNQLLKRTRKHQEKVEIQQERERLEDESRYKQYLRERKLQERHSNHVHNKNDLLIHREQKYREKVTQQEREEEERIWRKAQEMLKRQRDLLKQKEDILRRLKVDH